MNVRRATTEDIPALVEFVEAHHAADPLFACWGNHRPQAGSIEWWLREPRAIALAIDSAIIGFDFFDLKTGFSNVTCVSRENFAKVIPALASFEQSLTGIPPWGPVCSIPLLEMFVVVGWKEDEETGLIHWVGP